MSDNDQPDPIEAAIEATEPSVQMAQLSVTISSTGRPFSIIFPIDMTDSELAEAAGWMLSSVLQSLRAERAKHPASRILVPGGLRALS